MQEVGIQTEYIKLQQVLKLAGLVGQGSDAKRLITDGMVFVNGVQTLERGKKIRSGDVVEVKEFGVVRVVSEI